MVLLVLALGLYVAFTSFTSSREALRAQPSSPANTRESAATRPPTEPPPTPTPTFPVIPTPMPGITVTLTAAVSTPVTEPPPPTEPPAPAPTEPPLIQPTDTAAPIAQPPTPAPAPSYQFRLAGPPSAAPSYPNCCYIFGTVRDAAGNGLEGVQVQAFNEWNTLPPALTKGGGEAGQYNIPIGNDAVNWYIVVVDTAGNHISTQAPVPFDPSTANGFRVDWQRTY